MCQEYNYYCMGCGEEVDEECTECPYCGADLSEVVDVTDDWEFHGTEPGEAN